MNIKVLDCTLRDGGYCNEWNFGYENIKNIVNALNAARVNIIECGFLTDKVIYNPNVTKFSSIEEANDLIRDIKTTQSKSLHCRYVLMANYGEFDFTTLPEKNDSIYVDGIRIAFHKKDRKEALNQAIVIKEKGYDLYLQPMVTLSYTDADFLELIEAANKINPYAFYLVDSFGMMKRKELTRLFCITDHNLNTEIIVGFHSHNNMQLAYSNAQLLTEIHSVHDLLIDCSIYGMGRGAGNLNTELFMDFLKENYAGDYNIKPLIRVIDRVLDKFYKLNYWGYSLSNYLAASYNTHPNYANFLTDKNALNVEDIDAILGMMEDKKRVSYDREYIEELYKKYLSSGVTYDIHRDELRQKLYKKRILLIAPGRSSYDDREKIIDFKKNNDCITISVNHLYEHCEPDYLFLSNLRRFREIDKSIYRKCIVTSNISTADVFLQVDYRELLNDDEYVMDNAGLMAVNLLTRCNVREIVLAGFDGYSYNSSENYSSNKLILITKKALIDVMNEGMTDKLKDYEKQVKITFLTEPVYLRI